MTKDDLIMAHDNLQRELADIKRLIGKDKHALIKSNIALNRQVQELKELSEHHLKMLKYCSDARRKYYGVIKKLYEFDGNVQEHSKLADMLCGDVLEGEE